MNTSRPESDMEARGSGYFKRLSPQDCSPPIMTDRIHKGLKGAIEIVLDLPHAFLPMKNYLFLGGIWTIGI